MQALQSVKTNTPLIEECKSVLERLSTKIETKIIWVPGHSGVEGNEVADELAREGASSTFIGPEPAIGLSKQYIRSLTEEWLWRTTTNEWWDSVGLRQSKMMITSSTKAKTKWLLEQPRNSLRTLIGVLTGHCILQRHLKVCKVFESGTCPRCGDAEETAQHFLAECDGYANLRYRTFGSDILREDDLGSLKWSSILEFTRKTGRF